jgi:hypothetical protein
MLQHCYLQSTCAPRRVHISSKGCVIFPDTADRSWLGWVEEMPREGSSSSLGSSSEYLANILLSGLLGYRYERLASTPSQHFFSTVCEDREHITSSTPDKVQLQQLPKVPSPVRLQRAESTLQSVCTRPVLLNQRT